MMKWPYLEASKFLVQPLEALEAYLDRVQSFYLKSFLSDSDLEESYHDMLPLRFASVLVSQNAVAGMFLTIGVRDLP
jgi:uncharacterized protein (UPF0276 family)